MINKLQKLSEHKKKEGRSQNFKTLDKQFVKCRLEAIKRYIKKSIDTINNPKAKNIHKVLKQLGVAPGETTKTTFQLPTHEGLSDKEITNDFASFYSKISKEYRPLS